MKLNNITSNKSDMNWTHKFILYCFLISALMSCINDNTESKYSLCLNKAESTIRDTFTLYNSVVIYCKDSFVFQRKFEKNSFVLQNNFFKYKGCIYQLREKGSYTNENLGFDSILTFALKDTSFIYKSTYKPDFYGPYLFLKDCRFDIRKYGNEYITIKTSTIDTTYKEIFFYNSKFHIRKFIYQYRKNEIVYD